MIQWFFNVRDHIFIIKKVVEGPGETFVNNIVTSFRL